MHAGIPCATLIVWPVRYGYHNRPEHAGVPSAGSMRTLLYCSSCYLHELWCRYERYCGRGKSTNCNCCVLPKTINTLSHTTSPSTRLVIVGIKAKYHWLLKKPQNQNQTEFLRRMSTHNLSDPWYSFHIQYRIFRSPVENPLLLEIAIFNSLYYIYWPRILVKFKQIPQGYDTLPPPQSFPGVNVVFAKVFV